MEPTHLSETDPVRLARAKRNFDHEVIVRQRASGFLKEDVEVLIIKEIHERPFSIKFVERLPEGAQQAFRAEEIASPGGHMQKRLLINLSHRFGSFVANLPKEQRDGIEIMLASILFSELDLDEQNFTFWQRELNQISDYLQASFDALAKVVIFEDEDELAW